MNIKRQHVWRAIAIATVSFWTGVIIYTADSFKTPVSDLNVSAIHLDKNITKHVCDCSAQEKVNLLLIQKCKGK